MAIKNCSFRDMELNKFVECPDDSGLPAVAVKLCNPEDISLSPMVGATANAGETISGVKAIYSNGTSVFLGNANIDFQNASIIGVSLTSTTIGNEIRYQIDGQMYDSSFSFTDGEPVFLDVLGGLTQIDPDVLGHDYRVLIGYATGSNGLNINIDEPIMI